MLSCNSTANKKASLRASAIYGNGKSKSHCGEAQWWVMLPGVHPWLPAPTLHKGNPSTIPPVPAAGDAGHPLERGAHNPTAPGRVTPNLQLPSPSSCLVPGLHLQWCGCCTQGLLGSGRTQWDVVCLMRVQQDTTSSWAAQQISLLTA